MPWLLGWQPARSTGLEEKETSRCDLPAPTRAGWGALQGPGEAAVIHTKESMQLLLGHWNYGFLLSRIPRFSRQCRLWILAIHGLSDYISTYL